MECILNEIGVALDVRRRIEMEVLLHIPKGLRVGLDVVFIRGLFQVDMANYIATA